MQNRNDDLKHIQGLLRSIHYLKQKFDPLDDLEIYLALSDAETHLEYAGDKIAPKKLKWKRKLPKKRKRRNIDVILKKALDIKEGD